MTSTTDPNGWHDAAQEVTYNWAVYLNAQDPLSQAKALVLLSQAVFALKTWLPGFDPTTGTIPWERGESR